MAKVGYIIYDSQLNQYAFRGKIFKTKKEAVEQLVSYFSGDSQGDLSFIRKNLWRHNEYAGLSIRKVDEEDIEDVKAMSEYSDDW